MIRSCVRIVLVILVMYGPYLAPGKSLTVRQPAAVLMVKMVVVMGRYHLVVLVMMVIDLGAEGWTAGWVGGGRRRHWFWLGPLTGVSWVATTDRVHFRQ